MKNGNDLSIKVIEELKAFEHEKYEGIDLDSLIVFTLRYLERNHIPLYFDHITVAAFKLFPAKFSMSIFSKYPDTNRTNKAVRRLADPQRRNWATGNVKNGFFLTELGKEIADQVENAITSDSGTRKLHSNTRSRGRSSVSDIEEIKESDLFKLWNMQAETISPHEFFVFLKAAPYTPKNKLAERLQELKQAAIDSKDAEVVTFLEWMEKTYSNLL